jgi:hypothetical protein
MTTTTADITGQQILNRANINQIDRVFRKMRLGNMLGAVKVTFAGLAGAASHDITTAASLAGATIVGLDREATDSLPAIRVVKTLRVTAAGTNSARGSYVMTDVAGTIISPADSTAIGLARISDDGKTLTFPTADVTAFILEYEPRSESDLSTLVWPSGA